jgi:predicted nucleic acid-binding protein
VERLFQTDKRRVSLVDVVSFVVMEAEGLADVLGLDPGFAAEGFRLLP